MAESTASFRYPGNLLVVGGGRMGEAIVGGLLAASVVTPGQVTVAEPDAARREAFTGALHVRCVEAADDAVADADLCLLAVKPQVIDGVVSAIAGHLSGTLVVSIAAGVATTRLEALLPDRTAVVRVMPNTPALVGQGMAVVSGGSLASEEQVETVRALFGAIGEAIVIDEAQQDAAVAISGSGPAYFAFVIDSLTRAGVRHGLTPAVAQKLAIQTMRGTADLIEATGRHPLEVIEMVSSPGGTTVAALEAMHLAGLPDALAKGVDAAVKRSKELAS